ncbi:MAG: shikimate dehydrogenase, partial [Phycisphaerales bacterium]
MLYRGECGLIASITATSPAQMLRDAKQALAGGADGVELRLDCLDQPDKADLESLVRELGERCIITLRPVYEGGRYDGDEADRVSLLLKAAQGDPAFVDFECAHYRRSANIRQKIRLAAGESGLILSLHDFEGRPAKLLSTVKEMIGEQAALKVAWKARHILDNFEAFELLRSVGRPMIALCMGEEGILSRVLAGKFGALGTYCSLQPGSESGPGQLTLAEMKELYRFHAINAETEVYGVVGWPVAHSMSPAIFNAAFERTGANAVYLPMPVQPSEEWFRDFVREVLARPWLDMRGLSVTLPHKEHAFRLCRSALDEVSLRSGAVNTLTIAGDKVAGMNTDGPAALEALTAVLDCEAVDLRGIGVDVLGAGGAARAVAAALRAHGCRVTVFNRTPERAKELAEALGCEARPWEERAGRRGLVLINCTSVGMWPQADQTPMPIQGLKSGGTVFDAVYNPTRTRLLSDAEACECRTVSGLEMFIRQAAAQFEAWTGRQAPKAL